MCKILEKGLEKLHRNCTLLLLEINVKINVDNQHNIFPFIFLKNLNNKLLIKQFYGDLEFIPKSIFK